MQGPGAAKGTWLRMSFPRLHRPSSALSQGIASDRPTVLHVTKGGQCKNSQCLGRPLTERLWNGEAHASTLPLQLNSAIHPCSTFWQPAQTPSYARRFNSCNIRSLARSGSPTQAWASRTPTGLRCISTIR